MRDGLKGISSESFVCFSAEPRLGQCSGVFTKQNSDHCRVEKDTTFFSNAKLIEKEFERHAIWLTSCCQRSATAAHHSACILVYDLQTQSISALSK